MSLVSQAGLAQSWQANVDYGGSMPMDMYVPGAPMDPAPVVVSLHYCGGNKGNAQPWFKSYADSLGFIIITPQAGGNCFDATAARGGERGEIAAMVEYVVNEHNADSRRVFAAGASSGACMAQALAAAYPDVFAGGSSLAGVAAGAWTGGNEYQWSAPQQSDEAWGDEARQASEGYTGAWPRMQIWHGEGDTNLTFSQNWPAEVGQWTNLHGVSDGSSEMIQPMGAQDTWSRTSYADASGVIVVEANSAPGVPHDLTGRGLWGDVVRFFRLDEPPGPPEEEGGAGGMSGSAGMSGTAGATGEGTGGSAGGRPAAGGSPGAAGMPMSAAGSMGVPGEPEPTPDPMGTGTMGTPTGTPIAPVTPPPSTGVTPVPTASATAPIAPGSPGAATGAPASGTAAGPAASGGAGGASTGLLAADDSPSGDDGGCNVKRSTSSWSWICAALCLGLGGLASRRRVTAVDAATASHGTSISQ